MMPKTNLQKKQTSKIQGKFARSADWGGRFHRSFGAEFAQNQGMLPG